jgi:hypothetical protein
MNPKIMPFFSYSIVISLLIFISIAGGLAFGQGGGMETPEFARLRIERLRQTAKTLQELAHQRSETFFSLVEKFQPTTL